MFWIKSPRRSAQPKAKLAAPPAKAIFKGATSTATNNSQCYVLAPSVVHRTLLFFVSLGAITGIAITNLPLQVQVPSSVFVLLVLLFQLRQLCMPVRLAHFGGPNNTNNEWQVQKGTQAPFKAKLIARGYRSSVLLVLAFKTESDQKLHYVSVWNDSLAAREYSYLHLQLLFNVE